MENIKGNDSMERKIVLNYVSKVSRKQLVLI